MVAALLVDLRARDVRLDVARVRRDERGPRPKRGLGVACREEPMCANARQRDPHVVGPRHALRDGGLGAGKPLVNVGIGEHGVLVVQQLAETVERGAEPHPFAIERQNLGRRLVAVVHGD